MAYLSDPSTEIGAFLQEILAFPDLTQFNLDPCPNDWPHTFRLDCGDVVSARLGIWVCECGDPSSIPSENLVRCPTQRGPPLSPEILVQLRGVLHNYIPRANAVHKLYSTICNVENDFAVLHQLFFGEDGENWPELPPKAATRMSHELTGIRRILYELGREDIPDDPTEIMDLPKRMRKDSRLLSDVPGLQGFEDIVEDAFDPEESMLQTLLPVKGRNMTLVIYFEAHKPPYVAKCYVPDAADFELSAYDFPYSSLPLLLYSIVTEGYIEAPAVPMILEGRGSYMVYRKPSISIFHCPNIDMWERRARDSAEEEHTVAVATSRRSDSPPAHTPALDTVVDELNEPSRADSTPVAGPSRLHAPKRKAELERDVLAKKQRLLQDGDRAERPLVMTTSDFDLFDSDVEIVDN
ncbi:hypothetical protein R3P38DRAFT_2776840 [Favolaschia claudopus]|uniref:Uncharacterized protein n=1 Tax=Favolaschia claudopus TaxID=2862362 RepID=A0AAW0BM91_9AGAR